MATSRRLNRGTDSGVLQAQNPSEKAKACARVAEAWAAARGKLLTVPLDTEDDRRLVFGDNAESANLQRRKNAMALAATTKVDEQLESRDELRHAYKWWLKAVETDPGSTTAAAWLWQAMKAIPKIADVSPYTIQRALETGVEVESRKLYDRLRKDFSQSREANQFAVYWTVPALPPAAELPGWRDPNFSGSLSVDDSFGLGETNADAREWAALIARAMALKEHASDWDRGRLAAEAGVLRNECVKSIKRAYDDYLVNFADDLDSFMREPNLASEVRKRYVDLRYACMRQTIGADPSALGGRNTSEGSDGDADLRKQIAAALSDPKMLLIADYLEFLDLAVVANHLIDVEVPGRKSTIKRLLIAFETMRWSRRWPHLFWSGTQRAPNARPLPYCTLEPSSCCLIRGDLRSFLLGRKRAAGEEAFVTGGSCVKRSIPPAC